MKVPLSVQYWFNSLCNWASTAVFTTRNLSQNLSCTDISYNFGDENDGEIQYPLISFCPDDISRTNKILKDCNEKNIWTPFNQAVKKCLETDSNFKISILMDNLNNNKAEYTKINMNNNCDWIM